MRIGTLWRIAAGVGAAVMLEQAIAVRADDTSGRPVLDQAVQEREAAEEAAAKQREVEANEVKANADAEEAQTVTQEAKEADKEQEAGRVAQATLTAPADGEKLIDGLTTALGVSRAQAVGGAGAIFRAAKQTLDTADFTQVAAATPGIDQFLAAAPGDATPPGQRFGAVPDLNAPFARLGMRADMVGKFMPIVLRYVQENGGDAPMQLLAGAFK